MPTQWVKTMKTIWLVSAAAGAGYLLRGWTAKLTDSPEIVKLGETIRADLMNSAKAAAVTAASSRIESLNSRLLASGEKPAGNEDAVAGIPRGSGEIRDSHVDEPPESEEERAADNKIPEQVGEGERLSEVGEEKQVERRGETDDSTAPYPPEQEEAPRRRPRKHARGASTAREIRQWAVQEGYEISSRGRIPTNIEHAFRVGH